MRKAILNVPEKSQNQVALLYQEFIVEIIEEFENYSMFDRSNIRE